MQGFTIIEEQGQNLGLSVPVIELAKSHYKEIHKRKTIVHRKLIEDADTEDALERETRERYKRECVDINRYSQATIVTACVFLAIRREKTAHSLRDILGSAKKWSVARKELNRFCFRCFCFIHLNRAIRMVMSLLQSVHPCSSNSQHSNL
jgi:hypothetical protein